MQQCNKTCFEYRVAFVNERTTRHCAKRSTTCTYACMTYQPLQDRQCALTLSSTVHIVIINQHRSIIHHSSSPVHSLSCRVDSVVRALPPSPPVGQRALPAH